MSENEEIKDITAAQTQTDEQSAPVTETDTDTVAAAAEKTETPAPTEKKPKKTKEKKRFNSRKLKHGSLSVVFTLLFIAGIVLVNVITNLLLDRFNLGFGIHSRGRDREVHQGR